MKKKLDTAFNLINQTDIDELFSQVTSQEVEQFYKTYQLWSKHQQIARVQQGINVLREKQAQNAARMNEITPSAVALSTLAQLQASGVEDLDLLDRMLDRGEEWLDHTMELLERCEELNVIRGNYTQWCEHALEGAYEWMGSMDDASLHDYFHAEAEAEDITPQALIDLESNPTQIVTEDQLLRKLMSDDSNLTKKITVPLPKITQELPPLAIHEDEVAEKIDVSDQDFPIEIEEPEAETIEIDLEEQARSSAEQQRYREEAQAEEPDEHLEDLFPVEIAEPAIATEEMVERAQLLPVETAEVSAEAASTEELEDATPIEMSTDVATDTSTEEISADEPLAAVETLDTPIEASETVDAALEGLDEPAEVLETEQTPVSAVASQPEAVQAEIAATAPTSEDHEAVAHPGDDSSAADILTDTSTEQVPAEIETEETAATIETASTPEEETSSASLETAEPLTVDPLAVETESAPEATENRPESIVVEEQVSAPIDELDTPIMAAETATDAQAVEEAETHEDSDADINAKEQPVAQWPFVYQEIEETSLPTATSAEASTPVSSVKRQPVVTKQTKKKPHKEASRKAVKKKAGFFRRFLARFFRR